MSSSSAVFSERTNQIFTRVSVEALVTKISRKKLIRFDDKRNWTSILTKRWIKQNAERNGVLTKKKKRKRNKAERERK